MERRRYPAIPIVLGVALAAPSLLVGLQTDDLLIRSKLLGTDLLGGIEPKPWEPYASMDGDPARNHVLVDHGWLPWWTDPYSKGSLSRPLTTLTVFLMTCRPFLDGGPARLVRGDPGPHPAVRCATAVGAAWLTHVPERKVGDSSGGQRLMLRRNGTESLFPRRRGQDCNDGAATQERIAARKGLLLESSGSFDYDRGLKSDNWEIPEEYNKWVTVPGFPGFPGFLLVSWFIEQRIERLERQNRRLRGVLGFGADLTGAIDAGLADSHTC